MRVLRTMTFNMRRDTPVDGPNAWAFRRDTVAAVVLRHRPDVLGTQELLPNQVADLDERLEGYRRLGGCRRGTGQDEHAAIYYDAQRFDAVASGDVWLSDTPEVAGSTTWGNELPRHATWARLRDRASGEEATVVNTHFDHRSEISRVRAARFLAQRFPDAVLMGDFNAFPGGNVHATFLMAGFTDAGADEAGGTYHGWAGFGRERIDWILAPPGARVAWHRVVRERPMGRMPSDHDPVMAEVLLPVPEGRRVPVETAEAAAPVAAATVVAAAAEKRD